GKRRGRHYPNFFPGGRGYKSRSFPQSPIMFIGHNFDTDVGFYKSVERGAEDHQRMKTWINLKESFLPAARVAEDECFFTNFYLGAIVHPEPKPGDKKKTSNTGKFKCTQQYHHACVAALRSQVMIVRPKVIALLGSKVPLAFGEAFPEYSLHSYGDIAEIQSRQPSMGHRLQLLPDLTVQVIALVHPANPRSHESHRAQGHLLRTAVQATSSTG
ncbi:MAG TPA: uracil-DNA glycosylase family protein, partial [Acidobacteriaceae bacterium]|nr:uracil-DNA glycosylase family protein [Acidobacteriaceae bacterium]